MEWLKDKAWTLVLLVVVGLGGSVVGYQKGKLDKQVETLQAQASDLMRALAARQPAEGEAEAVPALKASGAKKAE